MPGTDRPNVTPAPGSTRPAAPDATRTLRTLKGLALGATVLATAGVTGMVLLHPAGAQASTTEETVVEEATGPVVTAQDPFFNRSTASLGGSQVRRSRRIILRSRGS